LNDSIYYFNYDGSKIDLMEYKMLNEEKALLKTVWEKSYDDDKFELCAIIFVENKTGKS